MIATPLAVEEKHLQVYLGEVTPPLDGGGPGAARPALTRPCLCATAVEAARLARAPLAGAQRPGAAECQQASITTDKGCTKMCTQV